MSVTTIRQGGVIPKDPGDKAVLQFNWDDKLPAGVEITGTPTVPAPSTPDTALTIDNIALTGTNRKVNFRAIGGTAGSDYTITCHVVTNETPAQEFERSFVLRVVDL